MLNLLQVFICFFFLFLHVFWIMFVLISGLLKWYLNNLWVEKITEVPIGGLDLLISFYLTLSC